MSDAMRPLKVWFLSITALCAVMASSGYALSRMSHTGERIQELIDTGAMLSAKAAGIKQNVLAPREIKSLQSRRSDLRQRMQDSCKPGMLVPQLSGAARHCGLFVLQIQPVRGPGVDHRGPQDDAFPNYRISVRGSYQQIAEFMQGCNKQRIPIRVVEFRIRRFDGHGASVNSDDLRAEITVSVFHAADFEIDDKPRT